MLRIHLVTGGVISLLLPGLLGGAGCTIDDAFLEGKPCGAGDRCEGGYVCVREPCPSQPGYLCPVCRRHPADGGTDGGDVGGDRLDGDNQDGDQTPTCDQQPPPCKTIPGCVSTEALCRDGVWVCDTGYEPVELTCDGMDNDCDGEPDNHLVCVLAGDGTSGYVDGIGNAARFNQPRGLVFVPSRGVAVADRANHVIRLVQADGSTTTLAGTGRYGYTDGASLEARFYEPSGLAVAGDGSILIADRLNHRIRRLGTDNLVTTVAGTGFPDFLDGPALSARFAMPTGLAVAEDGTIYVADSENHCLRKIFNEAVTTFCGRCEYPGHQDGAASDARFNRPTDLLRLSDGSLIVVEESSHTLRRVAPDGSVTTIAGTGTAGFADGPPLQAKFSKPAGCVLDRTTGGTLLVADSGNQRVRAVDTEVTTWLGSGAMGMDDGPPHQATFNSPSGLAFLEDGRLVIADTRNHAIRVLQP